MSEELPPFFHRVTLFKRADGITPLVFGMTKNSSREMIRKKIEAGGGVLVDMETGDSYQDEHCVILSSKDVANRVRKKGCDVFNLRYVVECWEEDQLLPNLKDYRLNRRSFFDDYDPLQVLNGLKKWSDLPAPKQNSENDDENDGEICSDIDEGDDDPTSERELPKFDSPKRPRLYTREEQTEILKFIIKKKAFSVLKSNSLWQDMSRSVCGRSRTWQSLKEHFRKQIITQINSFTLPARQISRIQRGWAGEEVNCFSDDEMEELPNERESHSTDEDQLYDNSKEIRKRLRTRKRRAISSSESSSSGTGGVRNPYTANDDITLAEYIRDHGLFGDRNGRAMWQHLETVGILKKRTWQSMKNRFLKYIMPSYGPDFFRNSENGESSPGVLARLRRNYSKSEDKAILDYIIKTRRFAQTHGNQLWKIMEAQDVLPDRTWQSMKERFIKIISRDLDAYDLEAGVKKRLLDRY